MKFEFEIDDKIIQDLVIKSAKSLERNLSMMSLRHNLEAKVEQQVMDTIIIPKITESINEKLDATIEKAVDKKLEGFVKRRVKETIALNLV